VLHPVGIDRGIAHRAGGEEPFPILLGDRQLTANRPGGSVRTCLGNGSAGCYLSLALAQTIESTVALICRRIGRQRDLASLPGSTWVSSFC